MWIVALFSGMLLLLMTHNFYFNNVRKELPWNATEARRDLGQFHVFATAAELYMRDHAKDGNFLPAGTAVVRWETYSAGGNTVKGLKEARGLPPALKSLAIDPTWRVRISGSSYVLCTGMTAGGVVKLAQLPGNKLWNPGIAWRQGNTSALNGSVNIEMVTFDVDAASAQSLCKCDPAATSGATQCS